MTGGGTAKGTRTYAWLNRDEAPHAPLDVLIEALESGRAKYPVNIACELIHRRPSEAAHAALRALSERADWYPAAAVLLGRLGDTRAVPLLAACALGSVTRSADGTVRLGCAAEVFQALGMIGGGEAERALLDVAEACLGATALARPPWFDPVGALVAALCTVGTPPCVDAALAFTYLMERPWDASVMRRIAEAADARFVPFLVEQLAGPDLRFALLGLERVATPRALPALLRIVTDGLGTRDDRYRAARAVTRLGKDGWDDVLLLVRDTRDPSVRVARAMAWMLGEFPWEDFALHHLRRLLVHDDPGVRARAADSLGRGWAAEPESPPTALSAGQAARQLDEVVSALLFALGDEGHRTRARASTAFGRVRHTRAVPSLRWIAETDPVRCVRDAASAALRVIETD
ncbi:HEAT repeat domain-containing protein [Yinghuangia seranimata]|uniref:HEAT repeat domain-containing protein n=1 Tax=Yinghuangia seranimata TaxID=408067 RepID=UPI00248D1312|nr:HEAT repeat domain-containing protein [Yinghuangia seranimata]MDI2125268.1 HEAT repeat domain-containing protein [Yinghuangia seranimata]